MARPASIAAVAACLLLGLAGTALAELPQQGGVVDLLDQANVRLDGAGGDHAAGSVASAGDVNRDGIDDMIIGASAADPHGVDSGSAFVVFGRRAMGGVVLADIGTPGNADGFRIDGARLADLAGQSVDGAGDVNGDGFDDVIVGADRVDYGAQNTGSAYVVFGKGETGQGSTVNLADIGTPGNDQGFRMAGVLENGWAGWSVAGIGHVNDDDLADVIVGAPNAGSGSSYSAAYVVFGKNDYGLGSTVELDEASLASSGFAITRSGGNAGFAVDGAGDVNGDARPDVIVGAKAVRSNRGAAYVVFGKTDSNPVRLPQTIEGKFAGGFFMDGAAPGDGAGWSVAGAGDINDDSLADVIVGAKSNDSGSLIDNGAAYLVFGKTSEDPVALASLGEPGDIQGFKIEGGVTYDHAGTAVGGTGDINDDGHPDVVVGAPEGDYPGRPNAGLAYVVFGKDASGEGSTVRLADIGPGSTEGILMIGAQGGYEFGNAGYAAAGGGDFNDDGRPDVVVGAPYSDHTYVVFGFGTPTVSYEPASFVMKMGRRFESPPPTVMSTGEPSFSVSPALPRGLALDAATGVISGTPTWVSGERTYVVTMTDLAGPATASVTIAVAPFRPSFSVELTGPVRRVP